MSSSIWNGAGCDEVTKAFATLGLTLTLVMVYFIMFFLTRVVASAIMGKGKKYSELSASKKGNVLFVAFLWPITIPVVILGLIIYLIIQWIILPFVVARKKDLQSMEKRINKKIDKNCPPENKTSRMKTKFNEGDLIVGVRGNPDNYRHLDEGSISKVLSIDEKGGMEVVLVDHKDFHKQKDWIGKKFKAPARNFVKQKKSDKKTKKKVRKK